MIGIHGISFPYLQNGFRHVAYPALHLGLVSFRPRSELRKRSSPIVERLAGLRSSRHSECAVYSSSLICSCKLYLCSSANHNNITQWHNICVHVHVIILSSLESLCRQTTSTSSTNTSKLRNLNLGGCQFPPNIISSLAFMLLF